MSNPSKLTRLAFGATLCATALFAVGCASAPATLTPTSDANSVPGRGNGAEGTTNGVRVVARAEAWQWGPAEIKTQVTPIFIALYNNGNRPVSIRYNKITLTDSAGHAMAVMPPYDINSTLSESYIVQRPFYGYSGFAVAPYLSRWYPRFSRYDGAFAYDPAYYSPYITRYHDIHLPTTDMIQRALPEGVLSPGGTATGFVYFEALDSDAGRVNLAVDVVNARNGNVEGTVNIPFQAR